MARLLELVPDGHEVVPREAGVELAVYVAEAGVERVREAFRDIAVAAVEPGWEAEWKRFHRATTVAGIWIGPPWERPPSGVPAVVIDPGLAFGTGAHPTTRLCVAELAALAPGALIDLGCGSGVLSIAAAKLGFDPVVALDSDVAAIEATKRNAAANRVTVDARLGDVASAPLPAADVAVANIALPTVEAVAARIDCRTLVTSGYFAQERPAALPFSHVARRTLDGWAADRFARRLAD